MSGNNTGLTIPCNVIFLKHVNLIGIGKFLAWYSMGILILFVIYPMHKFKIFFINPHDIFHRKWHVFSLIAINNSNQNVTFTQKPTQHCRTMILPSQNTILHTHTLYFQNIIFWYISHEIFIDQHYNVPSDTFLLFFIKSSNFVTFGVLNFTTSKTIV